MEQKQTGTRFKTSHTLNLTEQETEYLHNFKVLPPQNNYSPKVIRVPYAGKMEQVKPVPPERTAWGHSAYTHVLAKHVELSWIASL